jgi:hypothetical protein
MRLLLLCLGVLVACGDDATPGRDSGPPGSDAGRDAATGDAGEVDASEPRRTGFVSVVAADYTAGGAPVESHTVYVNFYDPGDTECVPVMSFGVCEVVDCPTAPGSDERYSAGIVRITKDGASEIAMMPDGTGNYMATTIDGDPYLMGGEMVRALADGGEVGAFDLMVVAPPRIVLSEPVFPAGGAPLAVRRDTPFVYTWEPPAAAAGTLGIRITADGAEIRKAVVCEFPLADGIGTIPTAALQMLPAGGGDTDARAYNFVEMAVGRYDVKLQLQVLSVSADGAVTSGAVALE